MEKAFNTVLSFLKNNLFITVHQIFVVFGILFIIGFLLHLVEKKSSKMLGEHFGWKSILWTGWIGVPIHELSHAAMCIIFGHKVLELVLYNPDPITGCLGYVRHSKLKDSIYQTVGEFFIGVAPLIGGSICMYFLLIYFLPNFESVFSAVKGKEGFILSDANFLEKIKTFLLISKDTFYHIFVKSNMLSWKFWILLYGIVAIGAHVGPSKPDIEGATEGFIALFVFMFILNGIAKIFGGISNKYFYIFSSYLSPLVSILFLALILNFLIFCAVFLITSAIHLKRVVR